VGKKKETFRFACVAEYIAETVNVDSIVSERNTRDVPALFDSADKRDSSNMTADRAGR
jgi:hypothetical protein